MQIFLFHGTRPNFLWDVFGTPFVFVNLLAMMTENCPFVRLMQNLQSTHDCAPCRRIPSSKICRSSFTLAGCRTTAGPSLSGCDKHSAKLVSAPPFDRGRASRVGLLVKSAADVVVVIVAVVVFVVSVPSVDVASASSTNFTD